MVSIEDLGVMTMELDSWKDEFQFNSSYSELHKYTRRALVAAIFTLQATSEEKKKEELAYYAQFRLAMMALKTEIKFWDTMLMDVIYRSELLLDDFMKQVSEKD